MKLINLTPHTLNLILNEGVLEIPSSGIARASQSKCSVGTITTENGCVINVSKNSYGEVEGLPAPEEGVAYIVSALTAQACPERKDVFITDDPVRDDGGRVIGCRGLAHI